MTAGTDLLQNINPHFYHIVERVCTPMWKIESQKFNLHNIILIYDGTTEFCCNDERFQASRGNLIYYKPGDMRWAKTNPHNLMKCYAVDFAYTCPVLSNGAWELLESPLPLNTCETIGDNYLFQRLLALFDELYKAWLSGRSNRIIRCRSIFLEILNLILTWKTEEGINYDKIRKVEKVIAFMTQNYSKQISLSELGSVVHINPSYLGTLFREVTGKTPIDYLISMRISKAKELLKDGLQVGEVSGRVGFNDIFYFSKCFKKAEGIPPSKF